MLKSVFFKLFRFIYIFSERISIVIESKSIGDIAFYDIFHDIFVVGFPII